MTVPSDWRTIEGDFGTVQVPPRSCLLCDYCTDVYWDYTNGPYLAICCRKDTVIIGELKVDCPMFKEES